MYSSMILRRMYTSIIFHLVDLCKFARHGVRVKVVAHAEAYVK